jgi:outer membrane receptor protein involved in Fe transport
MQSPDITAALRRNLPRVAAALPLVLATSLPAQSTDAASTPPATSDSEVVILSPFTVSDRQTHGYQATNSIGATRSNTPIKDVPLNIQVFTKDLAQDIIATSQIDLERYNAALVNGGADVHSTNAIQQAYNGFLFRGYIQNWGIRDGVREYDPVDMQGIARVELVKGPAAPLYGLSYPGGVMNTITKTVDFTDNFTVLGASIQNEGEYRATIDANYTGEIANGGKFGVRVNAARSETEDQREHSSGMVKYTQVNLEWQPYKGTEIKFLAEDGYREKPNGLGYFSRGGANGADTPLQIIHPEIPWTWNWADKYNMRTCDSKMYRGSVTQSIGENFSVTAYVQASRREQIDSEGWDASGGGGSGASWDAASGTGWVTNALGQEVIRKGYHHRDWSNSVHAYGATAVYKLETGPIKHTFTAGANAWAEKFHSDKGIDTVNFIDFPISTGIDTSAVSVHPTNNYILGVGSPNEKNTNDYYFANWQMKALDDRLKVNAAINRTNIKNVQYGSPANITEESKNSPMIGAMFDVTKEVSLFAVHSTSLFPTTDKNDFDVQMPPVTGKSYEGGVKVELLGGKISGTVSMYQIKQSGGSVRDENAINRDKTAWLANVAAGRAGSHGLESKYSWAADSVPSLSGSGYTPWASATQAEKDAAYASLTDRNGNRGDLVANPTANKSEGVEADIVFQPTANWQAMLSYAHNTIDSRQTGHVKDQIALLTKYSFTEGPVNGLSIGMGLQYASKAFQGTVGSVERYNPSNYYLETFAAYKFKAFGYDHRIQLNVKNLTKVPEYVGWYAKSGETVATHRYEVPTKIIWNLGYTLEF